MPRHHRSLRTRALLALTLIAAALTIALTVPVRLGLDLSGGTQIVLETRSTPTSGTSREATDRTVEVLRGRIDALGLAEPTLVRSGDHRILVELPDVQDPSKAADVLGRTAQLTVHAVLGPARASDAVGPAIDPAAARILPDETGQPLRLKAADLRGMTSRAPTPGSTSRAAPDGTSPSTSPMTAASGGRKPPPRPPAIRPATLVGGSPSSSTTRSSRLRASTRPSPAESASGEGRPRSPGPSTTPKPANSPCSSPAAPSPYPSRSSNSASSAPPSGTRPSMPPPGPSASAPS